MRLGGVPQALYRGHRDVLRERLHAAHAGALVASGLAPEARPGFRCNSDFWYLTGLADPGGVLLLLPDEARIYLEATGAGTEATLALLGLDRCLPRERLREDLMGLLRRVPTWLLSTHTDWLLDAEIQRCRVGFGTLDPADWIAEQRLIKGLRELDCIRSAAAIAAEAALDAMRHSNSLSNGGALQAEISNGVARRGAQCARELRIHAEAQASRDELGTLPEELPIGRLLAIDVAVRVDGYAAQVVRTYPRATRFDPAQAAVYGVAQRALVAALEAAQPGRSVDAVDAAARRHLIEGLTDLGVLRRGLGAAEAQAAGSRFLPRTICHSIGLDLHDPGRLERAGQPRALEPGMVLAIETALYLPRSETDVPGPLRGLFAHLGETVVLGARRSERLGFGAPLERADVEAACLLEELGPR